MKKSGRSKQNKRDVRGEYIRGMGWMVHKKGEGQREVWRPIKERKVAVERCAKKSGKLICPKPVKSRVRKWR